jgi:hypothetical protein
MFLSRINRTLKHFFYLGISWFVFIVVIRYIWRLEMQKLCTLNNYHSKPLSQHTSWRNLIAAYLFYYALFWCIDNI